MEAGHEGEGGNVCAGHDGNDGDWEEGDGDNVCDDQEENDDAEVSHDTCSGEVEVVFHICKTWGDGNEEDSHDDGGLLVLSLVGGLDGVERSVKEAGVCGSGHGILVDSSGGDDSLCLCRHDESNEICQDCNCLCVLGFDCL